MSTPDELPYRVVVHHDGRPDVDVTEGVRCLYDMVIQSMDWGSNFYSVEETGDVLRVAQACGFIVPADARSEFESYARSDATFYADEQDVRAQYGAQVRNMPQKVKCVRCNQWVHYRIEQDVVTDVNYSYAVPVVVLGTIQYQHPTASRKVNRVVGWTHNEPADHAVELWAEEIVA